MKNVSSYDSVDLLDPDHKAVTKMFIDHAQLSEFGALAAATEWRGDLS